jgi:hypothetical protein
VCGVVERVVEVTSIGLDVGSIVVSGMRKHAGQRVAIVVRGCRFGGSQSSCACGSQITYLVSELHVSDLHVCACPSSASGASTRVIGLVLGPPRTRTALTCSDARICAYVQVRGVQVVGWGGYLVRGVSDQAGVPLGGSACAYGPACGVALL